ncbi:MAG TPA: MarR family winged helix-turn-helix transcriptional regulator [Methylomirabilota bacterium]|nr:MarR family winged helix-turn-helix transcriptional regulator [Methylomirabilota bacterium]
MGTHYKGRPAEVRALDAYIKLTRAGSAVGARLGRRLAAEGLTPTQLGVLEALLHLGPLGQRALGGKLLMSGANITTVVDNLERRGLVRRERRGDDRRNVTVHLTADGRRLITRIFPGHVAAIVEAFAALTPGEQETLGRLAKKLGLSAAGRA